MPKTKSQLRDRALVMLGKLSLGQTPPAALADDMEDVYDQIYAKLEKRGLVTWSSTDSVPDEFVEDVTSLMAFERSEGIPDTRYLRIKEAAAAALKTITHNIDPHWKNPRKFTDY